MGLLSTIGAASGRAFGLTRVGAAIRDAYFNLTTLLLPGNGTNGAQNNTFLDSSSNNFTITRNGNTTQGTFSPFSQTGWSNYFNGSTDYLSLGTQSSLNFGTGNFTVEVMVYQTQNNTVACILASGNGTWGAGAAILNIGNGTPAFGLYDQNSTGSVATGPALTNNTWNHVAVTRNGNTITVYTNGSAGTPASLTAGRTVNFNTNNASKIGGGTWDGSTSYLYGYMSNLRVSNTVRTISVPTSAYSSDANTILLTCQSNRFVDNSASPLAITVNGTPSIQAFSPFAPTAAYSAATVGGSGYFDGNGDYLVGNGQLSTSTSMSTFTVEGWLYPTSLANNYWIIGDMDAVGATNVLSVRTGQLGDLVLYWYDGAVKECFSPNGSIRANQWNWFAIVVNNNAISMYVNSTTAASLTGTTTLTNRTQTNNFALGQQNNSVTFLGYMGNLRWSSGIARTISSIPTAPYTSDANTRLLVNFTNAGITDATAKNVLETVGNAQISTTQSKFGGSSMSFDGTGDYLFIPQSNNPLNLNWEFLKGDFTIEFWFRANSVSPTNQGMFVKFNGNASLRTDLQLGIFLQGSNLACNAYQSTTNNDITFSSAISINTWYHVAFVRSGTSVYAYLDGARNATIRTITGDLNSGTTWPLQIGRYTEASVNYDFNGYIDDLRVTKFARYSGATITVPSAAFPLQ